MKRAALLLPLVLPLGELSPALAGDLPGERFGQFAFLPHRRQIAVTPLYRFSEAQSFYDGAGASGDLPNGTVWRQQSGGVLVEYGLVPHVAADFTLSAVASRGPSADGTREVSSVGLGDTQFGVRWRLLDEDLKEFEPFVPTLTVRVGGIAPGSYDADLPFAPGPGAAGFEARVVMSDTLGASPFMLYGDAGWRWSGGGAPSQFFGSAGIGATLPLRGVLNELSAHCGYAFQRVNGEADLAGNSAAAWAATDWQDLSAVNRGIELGLGVTDAGGRRYQLWGSLPLEGENTPRQFTVGLQVRIPFAKLPRRSTLW